LITVTDRRILVNGILEADVVTAGDYYPFGITMSSRSFATQSEYRYGFNGKEKHNSTAEGSYDFGARIYDGRIGRWLSVDPFYGKFPSESPYLFGGGSPVSTIDIGGKYKYVVTLQYDFDTKRFTLIKITKEEGLMNVRREVMDEAHWWTDSKPWHVENDWYNYVSFDIQVCNVPKNAEVVFGGFDDRKIGGIIKTTNGEVWFGEHPKGSLRGHHVVIKKYVRMGCRCLGRS
jgi:RHS repeat-associated protein